MPATTVNFTTGPATLPDVGVLSYQGCVFSPYFESSASGSVVKDNAHRTVKLMEFTITVDGYVTRPDGQLSTTGVMLTLQQLLEQQGGALVYQGRGMDLVVNPVGGAVGTKDVAWGPVPELLEFQPLGGGLSAKVRWQVKVRIPVPQAGGGGNNRNVVRGGLAAVPLLQFNYETVVSYGEDGYSSLTVRGTLEIPLTRTPNQATRTLTTTADDLRSQIETRIMSGIDLSRFRMTRRNFPVTRDKRTIEWDFAAEEKSHMDLPPDCTIARGTYSLRPAKAGMGLCLWLCTLRATYTVRADKPRRVAWFAFLALLRFRMAHSKLGNIPALGGAQNPGRGALRILEIISPEYFAAQEAARFWGGLFGAQTRQVAESRKAWLIDFTVDEGLYLDSKTTTFSATWRLVTTLSHILLASGLWEKLPEKSAQGKNLWATSVKDISGAQSWLPNKLDPKLDIIVDFGGG